LPVEHYENFPVASVLLPRRLRAPIEAIYAFARGADDVADEGDATEAERLAGLDRYERALDAIERGETPAQPPFARIAWAIREHRLPVPLLRDLLSAFRQDVVTRRYATFEDLLDWSLYFRGHPYFRHREPSRAADETAAGPRRATGGT